MPSTQPIFFDESGRRKRWVLRAAGVLLVLLITLGVVFAISVLIQPVFPSPFRHWGHRSKFRDPFLWQRASANMDDSRLQLMKSIERESKKPKPQSQGQIVGAYIAPWEESGIHSLQAHGQNLTHLFPAWVALSDTPGELDFHDWDPVLNPINREIIATARQLHLKIVPVVSNSIDGNFQASRVTEALARPETANRLRDNLLEFVEDNGFDGLQLDFELVGDEAETLKTIEWSRDLRRELANKGRSFSIALEVSTTEKVARAWAKTCDFIVAMVYDEHEESGEPGPISSPTFVQSSLDRLSNWIPREKLIVGIGGYSYDWSKKGPAESLAFEEAMAAAAGYRDDAPPEKVIQFDPVSLSPTFRYEDDEGDPHEVWLQDAATAWNSCVLASNKGTGGVALWAMGMEDPSIWSFFGKRPNPQRLSELGAVHFPYEIQFQGEGDILRVRANPRDGRRTLALDPATDLIQRVTYEAYATPYLVQKSGKKAKELALTFDDGPDPVYTPQILATLAELKVPATFFVIGENAAKNPGLLRDIEAAGHDLGSHSYTHPNLGLVSDERVRLELNATLRVIQATTGRSTILFRPPYNADSAPRTPSEIKPVDIASQLGYIVANESIDPQDWNLTVPLPDGTTRKKTADDIVSIILKELPLGNTILLHDAGGDRTATIAALKIVVPKLQAMGYRFVTTTELAGLKRDQTMPRVSSKDFVLLGFDRVDLWLAYGFQWLLGTLFMVAIVLGIGRVFLIVPLALAGAHKRRVAVYDPGYTPTVEVIVAAYNEEKVVVRTVNSILASDYASVRVVVVDDGSKDGTSDVVRAAFANEPRVTLIQKPNGGKASALNLGIEASEAEIVVGVDADTQLVPSAIPLLVRHFQDKEVGAVAGNVKVGNATNLLTRMQKVEYVTSQNIDRRAYALLNCVTVVPGAIGAWRRSVVHSIGGYATDTLAEDMDLTWRVRRAGFKIETESDAMAFTEAPDAIGPFFRQRFRWAFGTIQCLWKHRDALFRYGFFGVLALPTLWIFQIVFQILAPITDFMILATVWTSATAYLSTKQAEWRPDQMAKEHLSYVVALYLAFLAAEFISGWIAFRMDKEKPGPLALLVIQRFIYRQMMYAVVWKSILEAIKGARHGWGKLERKDSVRI